jgi:Domain of unknown function (DUF4268)
MPMFSLSAGSPATRRPLTWEELPNRRACRIADYRDGCSISDTDRYEEYIDWFLDAGTRLRACLTDFAV